MQTKHLSVPLSLIFASALIGCRNPLPPPTTNLSTDKQETSQISAKTSPDQGSTTYEVRENLTVVNHGPGQPLKHNVWIALIPDLPPYQELLSIEITPTDYKLITDEYGNRYAEFEFLELSPVSSIPIQIQYQVKVNELSFDLVDCHGELPNISNQPELHIESNNIQITDLAKKLSQSASTVCDQVESFYSYVGDNLVYSYNGGNWGAQAALGEMGADCTEYASLMIALSRASDIPSRYFEGLYYRSDDTDPSARTEHAWLDVYLPGIGWVPMDPTLGRLKINREEYYARIPPNHIIVTQGRNPSTLRGGSYWTHLYWPGNSTEIRIEDYEWTIKPMVK